MSLLDHLVTPATYQPKYRVDYEDRIGNALTLIISKKDYSGVVYPLSFQGDGVTIKRNFLDESFFLPIAGTQIELTLIDNQFSRYLEFANASNTDYYVEYFINQEINAFGYLIPDTYQEDGWHAPFVTTITATDHLGFLKDHKFAYPDPDTDLWTWKETQITGVEKACDIITFILNKCFLGTNNVWWDLIPIRPTDLPTQTVTYGCLYNVEYECNEFLHATCEDVLKKILDKFLCRIIQYQNGYMIQSPNERSYSYGVQYQWDGAIEGLNVSFVSVYKVGGSRSTGIQARINGRSTSSVQKAAKQLIVKYKKEEKDENNYVVLNRLLEPVVWEYIENPDADEDGVFCGIQNELAATTFWIKLQDPPISYPRIPKTTLSFSMKCTSTYSVWILTMEHLTPPEPFHSDFVVQMYLDDEPLYRYFFNDYNNYFDEEGSWTNYLPDEFGFVKVPISIRINLTQYGEWQSFTCDFFSDDWEIQLLDWSKVKFRVYHHGYYNPDGEPPYTPWVSHPYAPNTFYENYLFYNLKDVKITVDKGSYYQTTVKIKKDGILTNNEIMEIEKSIIPNYHTLDTWVGTEAFYTYKNVILSRDIHFSLYMLEDTSFTDNRHGFPIASFIDYIVGKYKWYHCTNKIRASFTMVAIEQGRTITPFSWIILRELGDIPAYVISYVYNTKMNLFNMEVIFDLYEWILADGVWNDNGMWFDYEYWRDDDTDSPPFFEELLNS